MRSVPALFRLEPFGEFEDPNAAPGASFCDDPAPRWTLRRAVQNRLAMYVGGLVFMTFAFLEAAHDGLSVEQVVLRESVIGILALLYLGAAVIADARPAWRYGYLATFLAVMLFTASFLGIYFTSFGVYFAIMLATLVPWRTSRLLIGIWGLGLIVVGAVAWNSTPVLIGLIGIGLGCAVGMGIEQGRVSAKLRRAEQRASQLAVVAERERIARDLHDILGHSLTAVSIKSGLAARLVDTDPGAAKAQMAEVEAISRQALSDVRATASGMREVRLAIEIAGARSVLQSAGVEAVTPTAIGPMADEVSELLGYVVREAVTNVVRHSEATRCLITAGPGWVSVTDNGRGLDRDPRRSRESSGLRGLRQRIESAGGRLSVTSGAEAGQSGLVVRAELEGAPATVGASSVASDPAAPTGVVAAALSDRDHRPVPVDSRR